MAWLRIRDWFVRSNVQKPKLKLDQLRNEALAQSEAYGVEILDDEITPMDFVILALMTKLDIRREDAVQAMLRVHLDGSYVVGRMPRSEAERFVQAIRDETKNRGLPLQCSVFSYAGTAPSSL